MRTAIAPHELLPKGLEVQTLRIETGRVSIGVASATRRSVCPLCGRTSSRVHSRYARTISDLPWHGISVELEVLAKRFFCDEASCERKIFCERLPEVAARARKTVRLEEALLAIALELGGRAGARLAVELGIVAARDTLLRRIKGAPLPEVGKVRVLGVDDFAFKKGSTYGTILVDLEEHKVVDLLPERSQENLIAWFGSHPAAGGGGGHPRPLEHLPGRVGQRGSRRDARGRPLAPAPQPRAHAGRIPAPEAVRSPQGGLAGGGARGEKRRRGVRFRADHAEPPENARSEDRGGSAQEARAPRRAVEEHPPPVPRESRSPRHLPPARHQRENRLPLQGPHRAAATSDLQEESQRPRPVRAVSRCALERRLPQRQAALPGDPRARLPRQRGDLRPLHRPTPSRGGSGEADLVRAPSEGRLHRRTISHGEERGRLVHVPRREARRGTGRVSQRLCEADEALADTRVLTQEFAEMVKRLEGEDLDGWLKDAEESSSTAMRNFAL